MVHDPGILEKVQIALPQIKPWDQIAWEEKIFSGKCPYLGRDERGHFCKSAYCKSEFNNGEDEEDTRRMLCDDIGLVWCRSSSSELHKNCEYYVPERR